MTELHLVMTGLHLVSNDRITLRKK
jgi:hypothetical protein